MKVSNNEREREKTASAMGPNSRQRKAYGIATKPTMLTYQLFGYILGNVLGIENSDNDQVGQLVPVAIVDTFVDDHLTEEGEKNKHSKHSKS